MYRIELSEGVEADLMELRSYDQALVLDAIEDQLAHQPTVPTKKRKILENFTAPEAWQTTPPVWQLQVGDFRVFYDVDERARCVWVRAVRKKPGHKTTKEIL